METETPEVVSGLVLKMPISDNEHDTRSDEELVESFLDGDSDSFEELVHRYEKPLFAFIARFAGDPHLAEDVFQEAFLQVYKSAGMFDPSRVFRSWIYTIAVNKAKDALRRGGRRHVSLDIRSENTDGNSNTILDMLPSEISGPEEIFMNREMVENVNRIVGDMAPAHRAVIFMSYFQRIPHNEIAEVLGIPVGTVKSRLHAAVRDFAWRLKNSRGD